MQTYKAWQVVGQHEFDWVDRELVDQVTGGTHPGIGMRRLPQ
jgi:hypothetical protein